MRTILMDCAVTLLDLLPGRSAVVADVDDLQPNDAVARRLRELGFVTGESVRLVTRGPFGGDPLLVEIGGTRFALRRVEAGRVRLAAAAAGATGGAC